MGLWLSRTDAAAGDHIRIAKRVSNPGCYPTGALALIWPLVDAGILPRCASVIVNAMSGYSGGGKELIALCENPETKGKGRGGAFSLYGLDQKHKHLPEMRVHGGLENDPIFLPSYSNAFYRGMLVHIELRLKNERHVVGRPVTCPRAKRSMRPSPNACRQTLRESRTVAYRA